jgi:hypothetical protein
MIDQGMIDQGMIDQGMIDQGMIDQGMIDQGMIDQGIMITLNQGDELTNAIEAGYIRRAFRRANSP